MYEGGVKGQQVGAWRRSGVGRATLNASPSHDLTGRESLSDGASARVPSLAPMCASEEEWELGQPESPPQPLRGRALLPFGLRGAVGSIRIPHTLGGGLPSRPSCTQK